MNFNNGIVANPFATYNSWGENAGNKFFSIVPQNNQDAGTYYTPSTAQETIKQVFKNCTGDTQQSSAAPKKDCGCGCGGAKKYNLMQAINAKNILIAALVIAGLMIIFSGSESKN